MISAETTAISLLLVALVAVPLTIALSFITLSWYRRAVLKSMRLRAGPIAGGALDASSRDPGATRLFSLPPLRLQIIDQNATLAAPANAAELVEGSVRATRLAGIVYLLAGIVHSAIATILLFKLAGFEFFLVRTLVIMTVLAWPVIPTVVTATVGSRSLKLLGPPVIWISLFIITVFLSQLPLESVLLLWGFYALGPSLISLAIGNRRVRATGPLLVTLLYVFLVGCFLGLYAWLGVQYVLLDRTAAGVATVRVLGAVASLAVVTLFGLLAWIFFRRTARRYRDKKLSDQMLLLDTWWLLFTFWECILLTHSGGWLGLLGLLAFAGYKLVVSIGMRLIRGDKGNLSGAGLLLLRVFRSDRRSERLLDQLALQWRYAGYISMIAGEDLATANLEPHEFFEFMSGRLSRHFVKSEQDLKERVERMDRRPDPDGRFRINEFFCHDDTWRAVLQRLVSTSSAVLMDLRGFSRVNQGCVYEITQLINLIPLQRVVLTIDGTSDQELLRQTLAQAWHNVERNSPNSTQPDPVLRILYVDKQTPAVVRQLLLLLCGATPGVVHEAQSLRSA